MGKSGKELRSKRYRERRKKKIIRFCIAWGSVAVVIALVTVLIVSCASSAGKKNEKELQSNLAASEPNLETNEAQGTAETGKAEDATTVPEGQVISADAQTGDPAGQSEDPDVEDEDEEREEKKHGRRPKKEVPEGKTAWDLIESGEAEKVVFLTFDDGPGPQTERLLDILGKYDVKATFFVIGHSDELNKVITREYEEGHTVGVHALSHDYEDIYTSEDAFWEDNAAMNDIIERMTGQRSDIFRFPGGSSNAVSAEYNEGIMTRLTDTAIEIGYEYFDWNVSSGDAGETTDPAEIYQNVINGIEGNDISVVLMHDSHDFTIDAVEDIVRYCLDKGYTMLPLRKGIFKCRHGVYN